MDTRIVMTLLFFWKKNILKKRFLFEVSNAKERLQRTIASSNLSCIQIRMHPDDYIIRTRLMQALGVGIAHLLCSSGRSIVNTKTEVPFWCSKFEHVNFHRKFNRVVDILPAYSQVIPETMFLVWLYLGTTLSNKFTNINFINCIKLPP